MVTRANAKRHFQFVEPGGRLVLVEAAQQVQKRHQELEKSVKATEKRLEHFQTVDSDAHTPHRLIM